MLFVALLLALHASTTTAELVSSIPCEYANNEKLLCRQTSFIQSNLPFRNRSIPARITQMEWIESGAYILSNHYFDIFPNLKNVSLRANALTSLSILPFWSHLQHLQHLDLSQNRLISINVRDFQYFQQLVSLNVSLNYLTTIEPIWLLIPLHLIDVSQNGLNSIGYVKVQNSTSESSPCLLKEIYLNDNRGLLSFAQLQLTMMDLCPLIDRFQLMHNHWHCSCNDLINSLKLYQTLNLLDEHTKTLTGQCETPVQFRSLDIQKINEELVCDHLALFDNALSEEQLSSSPSASVLSRQIISLFLLGCIIGLLIGLCLHYCARRCHDLLFYILFKCDRQKVVNEGHVQELHHHHHQRSPSDTLVRANDYIYCPTGLPDSLPSYAQVMNDVFYLDIIHRQDQEQASQQQRYNEIDGEC